VRPEELYCTSKFTDWAFICGALGERHWALSTTAGLAMLYRHAMTFAVLLKALATVLGMIEEDALGAGVNDPEMDVDVLVFYVDSSADEHPEVRP
jgi:hypothetical protein